MTPDEKALILHISNLALMSLLPSMSKLEVPGHLRPLLSQMALKGYITQVKSPRGKLWVVTPKGLAAAKKVSMKFTRPARPAGGIR